LTKAIDLDSIMQCIIANVGIAFGETGDFENAMSDFNMAINIDMSVVVHTITVELRINIKAILTMQFMICAWQLH